MEECTIKGGVGIADYPPSLYGASYDITSFPELGYTMNGLDDAINERVSFLKEQINPNNKPLVNQAFEVQIHTLRDVDVERVALLILQKQKQLEHARDMDAIEKLYTELDALEWLQRQVANHLA